MFWTGYGATDVGLRRDQNEDAFLVDNERGWFAVADGVGGTPGGGIASKLAIIEFKSRLSELAKSASLVSDDTAPAVIRGINNAIVDFGLTHQSTPNLATTFTALVILTTNQGYLLHAGDSRLYGFHDELGLTALTAEHTLATERRNQGLESGRPEDENVLVNCMGNLNMNWTEYRSIDLANYDAFLLCSDGLNKMVPHDRLEQIMRGNWRDPQTCVGRMIDSALNVGGYDNTTAIMIKRQNE
ncbi:MAG: protein phosphatase 2C domain-containing protein [Lentisphaeria bacterium]|nr:protein phosphatase 2C domain-containing protein [Candidatus Neomarinimicrobiota bacterium]MCF7842966.1 protein phosphatase 2C domain-containing protein [Lentisphaeria bacterium]